MELTDYLDMAQEAARSGEHDSVMLHYANAMDAACLWEVTDVLRHAIEYAHSIDIPADRLAVYQWSQKVVGKKSTDRAMEQRFKDDIEAYMIEVTDYGN